MKRLLNRRAFTLIEMLMVMVIIGILTGMVFKLLAYATRQAATAEAVSNLEKLADALTEFRAEYGHYPPTQSGRYEYQVEGQDGRAVNYLNNPATTNTVYGYGLVAYLYDRNPPSVRLAFTNDTRWIPDTPRDRRCKERWAHLLPAINYGHKGRVIEGFGAEYTNVTMFVEDCEAWDNEVQYESTPPYKTYKLWSLGPDHRDNTADDVHKDRWDEEGQ